ncbi:MAG: metallophosphoesterase [Sumerlaeia bacterium]
MSTELLSNPKTSSVYQAATADLTFPLPDTSALEPKSLRQRLYSPVDRLAYDRIAGVYQSAPVVELGREGRLVIFSDLHVGHRGWRDDFLPNSKLFMEVCAQHYLDSGYQLALNGDVEELQNFPLSAITSKWGDLYELFRAFQNETNLYKIVGNHDLSLLQDHGKNLPIDVEHIEGLRVRAGGGEIFLLHGHQASHYQTFAGQQLGLFMKYLLSPLGFRNYSKSYESNSIYRLEKRCYDFARRHGVMTMIGHTHRPLFEALSKVDSLRYRIEALCREHSQCSDAGRLEDLTREIARCNAELRRIRQKGHRSSVRGSLYDRETGVPCLFNSGSVISKNYITSLEIRDGKISLAYWYDDKNGEAPFMCEEEGWNTVRTSSGYRRVIIRQENLDYLFTRIRFLA